MSIKIFFGVFKKVVFERMQTAEEFKLLLVPRTVSKALGKCGSFSSSLGQTHVGSCLLLCTLFLEVVLIFKHWDATSPLDT